MKAELRKTAQRLPGGPRGMLALIMTWLACTLMAQTPLPTEPPGGNSQNGDSQPAVPPVQSQDSAQADDPFAAGNFEAASQSPGEEKTSYLIGGNFTASSNFQASANLDGYTASAGISGKLFAKVSVPSYGSLYASYAISQLFFQGLSGSGEAALVPPANLFGPSFSLSELHYSFDLGKLLFVRVGNQLIAWGPSQIWTPVDFINLQRTNPFSPLDLRSGKPGLRLHLPLDRSNAFVFVDFSDSVKGGLVQDPLDSLKLAARIDATLGDFEYGLTAFYGRKDQAKAGFDFSGRLLGFTLYGEGAFAPAYDSWGQSGMASLGLQKALDELKRWTLSCELFWNSKGGSSLPPPGTWTPLYVGEYYAYVSLSASELIASWHSASIAGIVNVSDGSWTLRFSDSLSFPSSMPFSLIASWNGGGSGKEFSYLVGDNSFSLGIRTVFSF